MVQDNVGAYEIVPAGWQTRLNAKKYYTNWRHLIVIIINHREEKYNIPLLCGLHVKRAREDKSQTNKMPNGRLLTTGLYFARVINILILILGREPYFYLNCYVVVMTFTLWCRWITLSFPYTILMEFSFGEILLN